MKKNRLAKLIKKLKETNLVLVDQEKNTKSVVENYKKINNIAKISITKEGISNFLFCKISKILLR